MRQNRSGVGHIGRAESSFRRRSSVADRILRQFACTRCQVITLVCGPCDCGRVLCQTCASLSRLQRGREAGKRYRATDKGRLSARLRQRRCRDRKRRDVTHGASPQTAAEVPWTVPTPMPVALEVHDEKTEVKHCAFCGRWGHAATRIGPRPQRIPATRRGPRQPVWKGAP